MSWIRSIWMIFLTAPLFAQNGTEPIRVTDLTRIRSIGTIAASPDGKKVVYAVTAIEPDKKDDEYNYVNQLWLADLQGNSKPVPLTSKENAGQPTWSPDGNQIAFVRTMDGKPQIFLLPLNGGEAKQLTTFRYGATNPQFSPDGKQLLFSASVNFKDLQNDTTLNPSRSQPTWPSERPGYPEKTNSTKADPDGSLDQIRAYLEKNAADQKATVIHRLNFQDEANINPTLNFNHIFLIDLQPDAKPKALTRGFFRYGNAQYLPTGEIILITQIDSTNHPDRSRGNQICKISTDGKWTILLNESDIQYSNLRLSPSGKWMAFLRSPDEGLQQSELCIAPVNEPSKFKTYPLDRSKNNLRWSTDEKSIYFTALSNGGAPIYRLDISTGKITPFTSTNAGVSQLEVLSKQLVYVQTSIENPFELYRSDLNGGKSQAITELNSGWIAPKKISRPEKHIFYNELNQPVEYWVMKPTNYEAGKKYPLLLEIHGGPSSMWGPGESSMWHEYQYFCSQGYGVVYSNPRGSGGYGLDFLKSNMNDWGAGPTRDVLKALEGTIAEGWADTTKLLVTGGSYAGYLVAWIISHDKRFAAACSQRGVYELTTFFGEGNAWRLVPNYFGGYPWQEPTRTILQRESPLTYVENITTPYIIFHGDNDRRTGFVQSEMIYRSLKVLGRPVEYVRHPNATHEITRSGVNRQRIDQMLRTYEFFERWIQTNKK
jgi:dipeptidyl aminopeptidase/acylaminoacyl peptidase